MKARFKLNEKVIVDSGKTKPFSGIISLVMIHDSGVDYAIKADDDLEKYKCKEQWLTKIS